MSKNLKKFDNTSDWIRESDSAMALLSKMGAEQPVPLESISNILNPVSLSELQDSHTSKCRYKAFLHKGNVVCAKIRGNNVELLTQNGVSPDALPNITHDPKDIVRAMTSRKSKSIAGSFVAQAVELDDTEYYKNGMQINGYIGRGCYLSQKPPVNVKESFRDRVKRKDDTKGIAFFQIKPGANIITPEDSQFKEVKDNMGKEFFNQLITSRGVDGVVDVNNNIVVIFNQKSLDYVSSTTMPEVKKILEKEERRGLEL